MQDHVAYIEEAQDGAGERPGDGEECQEPEVEDHLRRAEHSSSDRARQTDMGDGGWSRW